MTGDENAVIEGEIEAEIGEDKGHRQPIEPRKALGGFIFHVH